MLEGGSKMSYYFFCIIGCFILKLSKCIFNKSNAFSRSSSDKLEMGRRAIGCCINRIMFSFKSSYISLLCLSHHFPVVRGLKKRAWETINCTPTIGSAKTLRDISDSPTPIGYINKLYTEVCTRPDITYCHSR